MRTWRSAMQDALYGPAGFYRRPEGPAGHFRTPGQSAVYAEAIGRLLRRVDAALGHPPRLDLVDVGAGRGELLRRIDSSAADLAPRLRLTGVEIAARPPGLPTAIVWTTRVPPVTGLLLATEWLDVVPLDVVTGTAAGPRLVLVDDAGRETPGAAPSVADTAWLRRWWPEVREGERAEPGHPRDRAWARAVGMVDAGLAVAVDYGHDVTRRPRAGTLTGFRAGRPRAPVPDGLGDLTAHVALDSALAAAGGGVRIVAADALADLAGTPVEVDRGTLAGLALDAETAALGDRNGLGGFAWLLHGVGIDVPLGSGRRRGGPHE